MTTKTKVPAEAQEKVLGLVAEWLATKGWGTEISEGKVGPAPTGPEAASRGLGPDLMPDWDWPGEPTPTVILEGGPYDWAVEACWWVQHKADAAGLKVFVEPYSGYALCVYLA